MRRKGREQKDDDDDDDTTTLASRFEKLALSLPLVGAAHTSPLCHTHVNSISVPVAGSAEADATRTQGRAAGATFAAERRPAAAAARGAATEQPRVAARADCIFGFVRRELEKRKGLCFASCCCVRRARRERERGRLRKGKKGENCGGKPKKDSAASHKKKEKTLAASRERSLSLSLSRTPTPKPKKMWLFLLRWALIFSVLYWALKR